MSRSRPDRILAALAVLLSLAGRAAAGEILVLAEDRSIRGGGISLEEGGKSLALEGSGAAPSRLEAKSIILVRFDPLPCGRPPSDWVCLQDGSRLRQRAAPAELRDAAALFFDAEEPDLDHPPASGVRVISRSGEVLGAPSAEVTEKGVLLEIDPGADPMIIPRERLQGVVWPVRPGAAGKAFSVDLRSGERFAGRLNSIGREGLSLEFQGQSKIIPLREIRSIWFRPASVKSLEDLVPGRAGDLEERPLFRRGKNALGGPLRVGMRAFRRGIGMRGPSSLEVQVPAGARWLLVDLGVDSAAAPSARATLEILVRGEPRVRHEGLRPGEPARTEAVLVQGERSVVLRASPLEGGDPAGCLGDFADAVFIE